MAKWERWDVPGFVQGSGGRRVSRNLDEFAFDDN